MQPQVLAGGVVSVPTGQLYLTAGAAKLSLALAVAGAAMLAADAVNDGNNQASTSPLFGSNANVAAASPNPLPPDGDDEEPNFKNSKETAKEFRIDTKNYERNIKQDILKDSRKEAANNKQLHKFLKNNDNPDIGTDSKGNIWLKSRISGKIIKTELNVNMYIE